MNDSACVTLRAEPDYDTGQPAPAFMPWTQIADIWLQQAGFLPTQRVHFAFDYSLPVPVVPPCDANRFERVADEASRLIPKPIPDKSEPTNIWRCLIIRISRFMRIELFYYPHIFKIPNYFL